MVQTIQLTAIRWHAVSEEDKRVLTQMLSKLYLPETVDDDKVRTLKLLIYSVQTVRVSSITKSKVIYWSTNQRRPLRDAIGNNALRKFDTSVSKKFEKQLEGFSEEEYRKLAELKDLFEFLDDMIPEDDDDDDWDLPAIKRGKKRYVVIGIDRKTPMRSFFHTGGQKAS